MAESKFDLLTWVTDEHINQAERIKNLTTAFLGLIEAREKSITGRFSASDVVYGTAEVYDETDHRSIFAFLAEAISAGVVSPTEVGGREEVEYDGNHTNVYLIMAENLGEVVLDDGQYLPPEIARNGEPGTSVEEIRKAFAQHKASLATL